MVYVHLSDEDKIQVLLAAFGLVLISLFAACCLAFSCCPVNKWLLANRNGLRRRNSTGWLISNVELGYPFNAASYQKSFGIGVSKPLESLPPPPAYEQVAERRADCYPHPHPHPNPHHHLHPQQPAWPPMDNDSATTIDKQHQQQLYLGDYFHQPNELDEQLVAAAQAHQFHQLQIERFLMINRTNSPKLTQTPPQLKLRFWVRILEAGELVERSRSSAHQLFTTTQSVSSSCPLSRQLSIPSLLGSLVSFAGRLQPATPGSAQAAQAHGSGAMLEPGNSSMVTRQEALLTTGEPLSSLASSTSSSSSSSSSTASNSFPVADSVRSEAEPQAGAISTNELHRSTSTPSARVPALSCEGVAAITSRVLHMNVASFGYVKDERLISATKHAHLNRVQFLSANERSNQQVASARHSLENSNSAGHSKSKGNHQLGDAKLCQLLISICDIQNLLALCAYQERACALSLLGNSSSAIYIQCEILVPPDAGSSRASRLLRCPLRALQSQTLTQTASSSSSSSFTLSNIHETHTLNFTASLPATALESRCNFRTNAHVANVSLSTTTGSSKEGKWRHSDSSSADGKAIVMFRTVPKELLPSLDAKIGSSSYSTEPSLDVIQFDSVFVSPMLSRSLIRSATLRFRVFSAQSAHLNESCLADLKVPLKQFTTNQQQSPSQVSTNELLLDQLIRNLVSASTGAPLAELLQVLEQPTSSQPTDQSLNHSSQTDSSSAELIERLAMNEQRSLMVSQLLASPLNTTSVSLKLEPVEEERGSVLLSVSYLPTSNRVIFHAHKAQLSQVGHLNSAKTKQLQLQSSTCYLLRFVMLLNGRSARKKQTKMSPKLEWDSQEPITFDLASVSSYSQQPAFLVTLLARIPRESSSNLRTTGSLQNLRTCNALKRHCRHQDVSSATDQAGRAAASATYTIDLPLSEPESGSNTSCAICRVSTKTPNLDSATSRQTSEDLVLGHLVLGERVWEEMRAQPRKQIVRHFKLY